MSSLVHPPGQASQQLYLPPAPSVAPSVYLNPELGLSGYNNPDLGQAQLAAFARTRGRGRGLAQPTHCLFCRMCYDADKGKSVYLSHNVTDTRCPIRVHLSALNDELLLPEVVKSKAADLISFNLVRFKSSVSQHPTIPGLRSICPVLA